MFVLYRCGIKWCAKGLCESTSLMYPVVLCILLETSPEMEIQSFLSNNDTNLDELPKKTGVEFLHKQAICGRTNMYHFIQANIK